MGRRWHVALAVSWIMVTALAFRRGMPLRRTNLRRYGHHALALEYDGHLTAHPIISLDSDVSVSVRFLRRACNKTHITIHSPGHEMRPETFSGEPYLVGSAAWRCRLHKRAGGGAYYRQVLREEQVQVKWLAPRSGPTLAEGTGMNKNRVFDVAFEVLTLPLTLPLTLTLTPIGLLGQGR